MCQDKTTTVSMLHVTSIELGQVDLCCEHVACCVLQKCLHLTLPVPGWAKQVFVCVSCVRHGVYTTVSAVWRLSRRLSFYSG